jgi:uncharacterized protein YecE (DUF72 family)
MAPRIGTSGWVYPHWRGIFYPEGLPTRSWFAFYAQHFDTVEINNTFYRLPRPEAFLAWRDQAPAGFVYAIKASRFLTHVKRLKDPEAPLDNLLSRARGLGPRLGPILYQLPPRWLCNLERLRGFLRALPSDLQHVLEFRDPSWCNEEVRALLTQAGAGFCIHDMPGHAWPDWVTGRVAYFRFHGPAEARYAGCYSPAFLRRTAERIRALQRKGHQVYAYFNNDWQGHAVRNAGQLRRLLAD